MVVDLVLKLGSFAVDYEEIASKEGLKAPVDIEIRRMLDQANELTSTMTYMRIREEAMRNTNGQCTSSPASHSRTCFTQRAPTRASCGSPSCRYSS